MIFSAYVNIAKVEKHTLRVSSKVYYSSKFLTKFLLISWAAPKEHVLRLGRNKHCNLTNILRQNLVFYCN